MGRNRTVICACTQCRGILRVSPQEKNRHEARDRKTSSTTLLGRSGSMPSPLSQPAAPIPLASVQSPYVEPLDLPGMGGEMPDAVEATSPPPFLPHEASPSLNSSELEQRGLAHEDLVQSGDFEQLARDDWEEDENPEDNDPPLDNASAPTPSHPFANDSLASDPFQYTPGADSSIPSFGDVNTNPVIYYAYLLVFWLHAQCHLSFRACNAVLACLALMFQALGASVQPPMYETLPSVMNSLGANPTFRIAPVCPSCMLVYPPASPADSLCDICQIPLFLKRPGPHSRRGVPMEPARPALQFPYKSLEEQLATMLAVPGIEDEIERSLNKLKTHTPGKYTNVFDGRICRELKAPDGTKFFSPSEDVQKTGELRVAVSLGVDWFSYLRSQIAPSHTSCPMSYSVMSLPPHLRYRTSNLLLAGIMPGPKEADVEQVHHFMRVLVNELLRLWQHGVVIRTPKYPNGRLVRVILIAVVCDKPAAHKLGGFGSHAHQFFCTKCWVTQENKAKPESFAKNGFRERTDIEHRRLQREYLQCQTKKAQADFVRDHATRWSELYRLPYFDICRMVVIDPMHNLFLGLVKTHFYHIWVQLNVLRKTKELRTLHAILAEIKLPVKLGRLPSLIGEPAGGSLTADQWLVFATVVAPLAVPQIWQDYMSGEDPQALLRRRTGGIVQTLNSRREAAAAARRSTRSRKQTEKARERDVDPDNSNGLDAGARENVEDNYNEPGSSASNKRRRKNKEKDPQSNVADEATDEATGPNLHPRDPQNFMKLSIALQILVSRTVTETDLAVADDLLRQYCSELVELYGEAVIRPNHHYAIHTAECVRDYGPLHEFWTFLFERMNKVLKSYKTSNHSGGELETSFFREFHRTVQASRLLGHGASSSSETLRECVKAMFRATDDDRGTVQALSRELDDAQEYEGIQFQLSSRAEYTSIPRDVYYTLLQHLQSRGICIHSDLMLAPSPESISLPSRATFFDHVTLMNTRYSSSRLRPSASAESLLAVRVSSNGTFWVGELTDIFLLDHPSLGRHWLGHMRWLEPITFDISQTYWHQFSELRVQVWKAHEYVPHEARGQHAAGQHGPPAIIALQDILCPAIRYLTLVRGEACWVTVLQDRNGILRA